jgi:putative endonuclease
MTIAGKQLGKFGEQLACEFLQDQGYEILARNWRANRVEIDIVALFEATLIFCEVKTRRSVRQGLPIEAVTVQKLQHIRTAALSWLGANRVAHKQIRFDVIGIIANGRAAPIIDHVQGIQI